MDFQSVLDEWCFPRSSPIAKMLKWWLAARMKLPSRTKWDSMRVLQWLNSQQHGCHGTRALTFLLEVQAKLLLVVLNEEHLWELVQRHPNQLPSWPNACPFSLNCCRRGHQTPTVRY